MPYLRTSPQSDDHRFLGQIETVDAKLVNVEPIVRDVGARKRQVLPFLSEGPRNAKHLPSSSHSAPVLDRLLVVSLQATHEQVRQVDPVPPAPAPPPAAKLTLSFSPSAL